MSKSVTCKICGEAHPLNQPHRFAKTATPKAERHTQEPLNVPVQIIDPLAAYIAAQKAKHATKMRNWRAKRKTAL